MFTDTQVAHSILELFTIGIGPSSSHTVGPMRAARRFVAGLDQDGVLGHVDRLRVDLYGSLAATGRGHGTDSAVLMGLEGETPERVDPDCIAPRVARVRERRSINLLGKLEIGFVESRDLSFHKTERLPGHPNGLSCTAFSSSGCLRHRTYYSVGGGFVVDEGETGPARITPDATALPYPFTTADDLLRHAERERVRISKIVSRNEQSWRPEAETRARLLTIWQAMQRCVEKGCSTDGVLPGGLRVRRRVPALYRTLVQRPGNDPLAPMDWVNLYALAVNEENAAGGRVVTAPTNGAAGIIPAVLHYYAHFVPGASDEGVVRFLLTAGAIGLIVKENASISGAEVGCQGEVGTACAMAAAGLTEVLGGSSMQVENSAEIALEHHLGLTCDPIGGLVQIPCIERNAIASVKAINAARIALHGDGQHVVSLDKAIKTMRATGADMLDKYKETARGGLAVNVIEC